METMTNGAAMTDERTPEPVTSTDPEVLAIAEIEQILARLEARSGDDPKHKSWRGPAERVIWYVAERYGVVGKPKVPGPRGGRAR